MKIDKDYLLLGLTTTALLAACGYVSGEPVLIFGWFLLSMLIGAPVLAWRHRQDKIRHQELMRRLDEAQR